MSEESVRPERSYLKVGAQEVALFTRQLAVMLSVGVPVHQALMLQAGGTEGVLREVSDQLVAQIGSGHQLSRSLSPYPRIFSPVFVGLVEVGEASGQLVGVLMKLAELLEGEARLRRRMSSALVYPMVLMAASLGGAALFMFYTLPQMLPLYRGLGVPLPLPTRSLIFLKDILPYLAGGMGLLALLLYFLGPYLAPRIPGPFIYACHQVPLTVPGLGLVYRKLLSSRLLYALATMLEVGVPLDIALERCMTLASNRVIASGLVETRKRIREGSGIAEALRKNGVFPKLILALIRAGEEAANVPGAFRQACRLADLDVDTALDTLTGMLEPAIMISMGTLIGWMVLASLMPMARLIDRL